ncbi:MULTISPECIES: DUF3037 domain-containing protein [Kitasatospora]|uniref:DUF3037 domain-containing protein n=1 Tax=Kitasatospora cathayae TaxID=3004092 RepID=A0ABY7PZ58_9ACTN|nr:DUF3037 domain-containing protein [Kitasatospora sp. HUAS 3-15]WBP85649.1 DUF3037 domain-containing protein [Kitasatospora sp. HUAS 3-15]
MTEPLSAALPAVVELYDYEYAVIRAVPRVERGECVNVGVLLYCRQSAHLAARTHLDQARLLALDPVADVQGVRRALQGIEAVCLGGPHAGPAAADSPGQRFRWLTAPRSAIIQPGPVHTGLTADPDTELRRLFDQLVL